MSVCKQCNDCVVTLPGTCVYYSDSALPLASINTNDKLDTVIKKLYTYAGTAGGGIASIIATTPLNWNSGTGTLSIQIANGAQNGYLSSGDWSTFNAKVSTARTINTTSPLTGGGDLSANRTIAIQQATGSQSGYLASADWNTFNNKVSSSRAIATSGSITGGGDFSSDRTHTLVNDQVSPGVNKYYGTSTAGTKGFFDLPIGYSSAVIPNVNGLITGTINFPAITTYSDVIVDKVIIAVRVVTGSGGGPLINVGSNASSYDNIMGDYVVLNSIPGKVEFFYVSASEIMTLGTTIKLFVETAASGYSAFVFDVIILYHKY